MLKPGHINKLNPRETYNTHTVLLTNSNCMLCLTIFSICFSLCFKNCTSVLTTYVDPSCCIVIVRIINIFSLQLSDMSRDSIMDIWQRTSMACDQKLVYPMASYTHAHTHLRE